MKQYKWQLQKHCTHKLQCPNCGAERKFVPYVLATDNSTVATDEHGAAIYGRCDREQNCGYHKYPKNSESKDDEYIPRVPKYNPLPAIRFSPSVIFTDTNTQLFQYACNLVGREKALQVWADYNIGADGQWTIFWQIDKSGEVHTGKEILYAENGHRRKDVRFPALWTHRLHKWDAQKSGEELMQCFFGEHLLAKYPSAKVCIVESEKTAAMMSAYTHNEQWIWLASGGSQGLCNKEKNKALEGRDVYLCPDNKQYYRWQKIAHQYGWHIFDQIERYPLFEGCDILDMVEAGMLGKDLIFTTKHSENTRIK